MPADPDRRQRIKAAVKELQAATPPDRNPDDPLSQALASASLPEVIALVVHLARAEGRDEVEDVEIWARALPGLTKQELLSWDDVMRPLGYAKVSSLLRRMARSAPSKPCLSFMERWTRKTAKMA
ncbi:hypothetical protein ACVW1A_006957 [Bradyrhizobium sp. LB1.3]